MSTTPTAPATTPTPADGPAPAATPVETAAMHRALGLAVRGPRGVNPQVGLTLEEPCLLAAPGGDPNTESSLDYIPGGALRGALAAAYRRNGNDAGPTFENLFLSGKARYLNAYPLLDGRTLPAPRAWTKLKDAGEDVYNRAKDRAWFGSAPGRPDICKSASPGP